MFKVLVIDDERLIRKLVNKVLERAGYKVKLASSGSEALLEAKNDPPDLLVADISLPDLDFLKTLKALRELNPRLPTIAMLGSSGQETQDVLTVIRHMDFTRIVKKPFSNRELPEVVGELLADS